MAKRHSLVGTAGSSPSMRATYRNTAATMVPFRESSHYFTPYTCLHLFLRYWDWTLDWENIEESPIFSSELGFGGDGDRAAPTTIGGGHCVQTGPFSHLKPQYYGSRYDPHCLSRGFANFPVEKVTPTAVQAVLDLGDYETFFLATENGPHNVAPFGIKGDFDSFTAPYGTLQT